MNKIVLMLMIAMLTMGVVSASDSSISEDSISMAYEDVRVVQYCIDDVGGQQNIDVVVTAICKDANSVYGCQPADGDATGLFSVVPSPAVMNEGECVDLILTTTITDEADGGNFYYSVNGEVGGAGIGTKETGLVQVPEFGILAAFGVLALAGLFIYRKRD